MLQISWKQPALCTGLWTMTFALAVGGTLRADIRLMFWSALLGLVACMVSGWLIAITAASRAARAERLDLEHLATIMAHVAAEQGDVTRIHH